MIRIHALRRQAIQQAARISDWLDQSQSMRRILIVGALLAAGLLSWRPSGMVALAVYGAVAVWFLAQRPRWVVPILILVGALAPTTMRAGKDGRINAAMLVVSVFIGAEIVRILVRRKARFRPSPANAPWLALVAVAGFSVIAGQAQWNPWVVVKNGFWLVQLAQWSLYLLAAGAYFFSGTQLDRRAQLQTLLRVVLFLGLLRVAFWLGLENHLKKLGILGGPIIRIWIVAVAMASGLFIPSLGRRLRAALLGLAAFILLWPLVYLRDWASGWLPALVGAIVVGLLWVWKVSTRAAVFTYLMVVLSGPLFYVIARGLAQDDVWSLDTRIIALRGLTTLLEGRWLLGLGLAAYWHYWRDVIGQMSYIDPATGYFHFTLNPTVNTHNNYLDVLGQMGVLGLVVFLWLLAALAYQGLRSFLAEAPGFGRAYAAACVGGLAGMAFSGLLGDWIIPFVYNIGMNGFRDSFIGWLLLGGLTLLDATRDPTSTGPDGAATIAPSPAAAVAVETVLPDANPRGPSLPHPHPAPSP
ncbi:MAG: hypothetical protein IPJ58_14250 [Ardenticatenia bacterium]|nr:hypothetical protein [Ardenticatenia bacterium]